MNWNRDFITGGTDINSRRVTNIKTSLSRQRDVHRRKTDRKSLKMFLFNHAPILLVLLCIPKIHGTTCLKIEPSAFSSGYMMPHPNKKFQSGNVTQLEADSEMLCYQICLNDCLCYFVNYIEIRGKKFNNCELVKYSSCSNKSGITSNEAIGWTGIQLGKVCSL